VGGELPAPTTLRQWMAIVHHTSTEALHSLRDMTVGEVEGFDRISKSFLNEKDVQALVENGDQQALVLELYAR